jgi:glucose uptake protein
MIAALWGVFVWKEFAGAAKEAWAFLVLLFAFYVAAIGVIAMACQG